MTRTKRRVCTGTLSVLWATLLGCAGSRDAALQPRTQDATALRAEAAANPASPEPWVQLALLERGRGDADASLAALQQALQRDPQDIPALTLLAKLFHECGRSADGLRYFAARPLGEWPEPVRLDVALLLADAGYTVPARETLESLRHGAFAAAAEANLAWLDLLEGKLVEVPAQEDLASRNNRAVALLRAGRVDESETMLRQLLDDAPGFHAARTNLALLLRHWRFDEDAAQRVAGEPAVVAVGSLSDAAVQELLQRSVEDASPEPPAKGTQHESY